MPPENPAALIVVDFSLETGKLVGNGTRVYSMTSPTLFASWYSGSAPKGYHSICRGLVFVLGAEGKDFDSTEILDVRPPENRGCYEWREPNRNDGIMFAMVLPAGHTFVDPDPMPTEVKSFEKRMAAHWRTSPTDGKPLELRWQIRALRGDVEAEIQRITGLIFASRKLLAPQYDVALSYASEDNEYVEQTATALKERGISLFYDRDEDIAARIWGTNLYDHLSEVYSKLARFTVIFISKNYANKRWTNHERQHAQARAFVENREYILSAKFDDTELPGLLPTIAYVSLKNVSPDQLADMIRKKVESTRI